MCRIAEAVWLKNHPVAIYRADSIPEGANLPGDHCGIPRLLVRVARCGGVSATDMGHSHCHGSKSGFGFGGIPDRYVSACSASVVPEEIRSRYKHKGAGQSYFKNPEIALQQMETIKDYGDGKDVIVFEDLDSAESEGKPIEVVVFLVDPARLTALMQLAAFSKTTPGPAAIMPYGHACQQIYAIPRAEGESDDPHAVVGMTDMYARRFIAKDQLSFAVPYKLYRRMDSDLDESFLTTGKFRLNMDKCI
ncbi:MAG: DUF169 domain-containing protein [Candidatus Methanomethylophilus sp.]|nr:DUF169 domain-containing protein [Methanomethylophilus sp.]MBQ4368554.1 DUF169 domain-containing protein [Methanomethylophilus sp.]MBQ4411403.1 DUF169 domain-containing protein [Methanomethylophilus sp.]MBQ5397747.1 DUF169 domain-containing protein [Methanomethylophilus sp.]MBQ5447467.1 DUF169 domain-containing protein [Methanomethylophilus sp.]